MGNIFQGSKQAVRTGFVSSLNPEKGTIKVKFDDVRDVDDNPIISHDIQVGFRRAYGDRSYWMPDIDEQVVVIHDGRGIETAYSLGAVYSDKHPPPVTDPNKCHVAFRDGTTFEYDRKEHALAIRISGEAFQEDEAKEDADAREGNNSDNEGNGEGDGEKGGTVDVYVEETITVHANGDITVTTDANVRIEAEGKIDIIAKDNITVKSDADILVQAEGKIDAVAKGDITAKTDANLTAEAQGNATVKAQGNIDLDAGGNMTLKAQSIDINADGAVTIKGSSIDLN